MTTSAKRFIGLWLYAGAFMVLVQVAIGGITRLTDSGLSITEWEVVEGTLPPLNQAAWQEAFEDYKVHAKKQYESLHLDMTLSEFKVIYFWEWFHRLWARIMGFVFVIPLAFFIYKRWIPAWLGKRLIGIFLLALLAAVLGWFMVASGLNNDNRTWVNAYNLVSHLAVATLLFAYILFTAFRVMEHGKPQLPKVNNRFVSFSKWLIALTFLQIMAGGLMAGMRAGLIHPHWPFFVGGESLLSMVTESSGLSWNHFIDYEPSRSVKSIVQLVHRFLALVLSVGIAVFIVKTKNQFALRERFVLGFILLIQYVLGVVTIISCVGSVPVTLGVLHQVVAILLFGVVVRMLFIARTQTTAAP